MAREVRIYTTPTCLYCEMSKKVGEKYRCNVCGNEVTVTKVGGGTLVCYGQDMKLISS